MAALEQITRGIIQLAGEDKLEIERFWRDKMIKAETDALVAGLKAHRDADLITQAQFEAELPKVKQQAEQLAADDLRRLSAAADQVGGTDAVGTMNSLMRERFNALRDWSKEIAGHGRAAVKEAAARMGIGGRPSGGSYLNQLLQNQIAGKFVPLLGTVLSTVGPDAIAAARVGSQKIGDLVNLLRERSSIPFRTSGISLLPQQARYRSLGEQIRALGGIENISRQNYLGTQATESPWMGLANVVGGIEDILTSYYTGGASSLLGGMMGGKQQGSKSGAQWVESSRGIGTAPGGGFPDYAGGYNYFNPAYYGPSAGSSYRGNPQLYDIPSSSMPASVPVSSSPTVEPDIPYSAYFTGYT